MIKGKKLFWLKIVTALAVLAMCIGPVLAGFPTYADDSAGAPPLVVDAPVVDAPVADAPIADAPVADAPVVDAPVADAPVADAPAVDDKDPAGDTDAPVADAPTADTPVVDAPVVDAPVVDAQVVDAPAADAVANDAPAPDVDAAATDTTQSDAAVATDQFDYQAGETVGIAADGFVPNSDVTLTLTNPDGSVTQWTATANENGAIDTSYELTDGIQGIYVLEASDGTSTASTLFTDPQMILRPDGDVVNNLDSSNDVWVLFWKIIDNPNYQCVDDTGGEGADDDDSTYVYTDANNFRYDLYSLEDPEVPTGGSDTTPPNDPTSLTTNHALDVWSNDPMVYDGGGNRLPDIVWSGATDPGGAGSEATINFVKVWVKARTTDGSPEGGEEVRERIVTEGGTTRTSVAQDLTNSYDYYTYQLNNNPEDSQPWDWEDLDNLQAGLGLKDDGTGLGNRYSRATQLFVEVDYNAGSGEVSSGIAGYYYVWVPEGGTRPADLADWDYVAHTSDPNNLTIAGGVPEGINDFYLCTTDNEGNHTNTIDLGTFMKDYTAPAVSGTPETGPNGSHGWYITPVVIAWHAGDSLSGFDPDGNLTKDWTTTISTQGKNLTDTESATDLAGNTGTGTSAPGVNIDWTAPIVNGSPNTAPNSYGWYNNNVTIAWLAQDNLSGFNSSGSQLTKTWNTSITTEGTNLTDTESATDWAGNTGTGTSAPGVNIDKTDPTLSGTPTTPPNADGWYNTPVLVLWTAQDTLSGLIPDGSKDPQAWNTTIDGEGRWESSTQSATDLAGNTESETVSVKIDQTAPLLYKSMEGTEGDNGWYISPVDVTLTAFDPGVPIVQHSGINYIQYQVDGNAPNQVYSPRLDEIFFLLPHDEGLPLFSTDFSINDDGVHTLQHEAYDVAGNDSDDYAGDSQQIRVDQTAPTLEKTINGEAPKPQGSWYNKQDAPNGVLMVALNAHDDTSGVGSITYAKDGNSTTETNNVAGADEYSMSNDFSATFEITKQGTTDLNHQAADYAGNTYTLEDQQVRLDSVDPTLVKVATRTGASEITVTLSGSDATSGVDYIRYSVDGGGNWAYANVVDNQGPHSMATTFVLTGVGDHSLGHLVLDVAGNQYVLADQIITLDEGSSNGGTIAPPPTTPMITVDMMGTIAEYPVTPEGKLIADAQITSPDGKVTLEILAGTLVLNNNLTPTYQNDDYDIVVKEAGTPAAPAGYQMIAAYEASPSGLTFSPDARFRITYDQEKLPAGSSAVIAYYDEAARTWEPLETAGYVAAVSGIEITDTVVSRVGHFTYFAVLAKLPAGE